jgi:hypothetical protein
VGSHHWPILLDNGEDKKNNQKFFYFLRKNGLLKKALKPWWLKIGILTGPGFLNRGIPWMCGMAALAC